MLNPIQIPNYINEKIMKLDKHFGGIVEETIQTGIAIQASILNEDSVAAINNIFRKKDINYNAIRESLQEMSTPNKNRIGFWQSILEANSNIDPIYEKGIKNIISLIEADTNIPNAIEGDGEEPTDPNPTKDSSEDQEQQEGQTDQGSPEQQLSPDQLLQIELAQTDNKFLTIVLYDKIIELMGTIDTIKDSVSSSKTEENLDLFEELMMYYDYLNILSELIFVMDLNTVYYNFTNISLEVNDLLDKYLVSTKLKALNDPKTNEKDKNDIIDTLRDNLDDKNETDQEIQDEGIQ